MVSISIIIPVYNVEQYIEACLKSVIAQTYKGHMECLIVDDCNQDNGIEIAQNIIANYQGPIIFRILHHDQNRGLSAARNTGMKEAIGDYLFFVDSDDELPPNSIEQLAGALDDGQHDIVVGDIKTIGNDALHEYLRLKLDDGTVLRDGDIIHHYKTHWNMMAQAKLYKASFLRQQRLTFMEGLIHEDELWSFEIACMAKTLKAIQYPVYLYYLREGSITDISNKDPRRRTEALKVIAAGMTDFLKSRKIFNTTAYTIIQKTVEQIFHYERIDRNRFIKAYIQLHKDTYFPWIYHLRGRWPNLRDCVHDLHYLLPTPIGWRYKYWRINK